MLKQTLNELPHTSPVDLMISKRAAFNLIRSSSRRTRSAFASFSSEITNRLSSLENPNQYNPH